MNVVWDNCDNYLFAGSIYEVWLETLWCKDWSVDREIFDFKPLYTPPEYMTGLLAESWEQPDAQTIIVHLRKGIHWQDKPPVNGREFTADDVVQHYDKLMGTGSGYTQPSAQYAGFLVTWDKVTAIDDYTVQFKFKNPGVVLLTAEDVFGYNMIEPPEVVKAEGGMADWKNAVGTGPWIVSDYQASTSITFVRNPNYWRSDPRHPENVLPYADTFKIMYILDMSTAEAALRTGKIDMMDKLPWQQAESLTKTNPDLQNTSVPSVGPSLIYRDDKEPFTDIKVRKALQLAVNLEAIADNYYHGTVDATPVGLVSPSLTGYNYPYSEWSQELKDEYSYNPTKAKQLLAEAGYPNGFKTSIDAGSNQDLQLLEALKAYLSEIGVDMEIIVHDPTVAGEIAHAGKNEQMYYYTHTGMMMPPSFIIASHRSNNLATNWSHVNSAEYDAICEKFDATSDPSQLGSLLKEADKLTLEQHWVLDTLPAPGFTFWQPYIKGYSGEAMQWQEGYLMSGCWVDQDLKKSMGR
jgi:peptide/nickel transport system substrate-binding protein